MGVGTEIKMKRIIFGSLCNRAVAKPESEGQQTLKRWDGKDPRRRGHIGLESFIVGVDI